MTSGRIRYSQILRASPFELPIDRILHVDETGIYAVIRSDMAIYGLPDRVGIGRYSFDYKCNTQYLHHLNIKSIDAINNPIINTPSGLVYVTDSTIYTVAVKNRQLVARCSGINAHDCVYHPIRNSYFVVCEDGQLIELNSEFRRLPHSIIAIHIWHMLPSQHSTILYTTWQYDNITRLGVIHDMTIGCRMSEYFLSYPPCYSLSMRPDHPETLVAVGGEQMATVDLWHAQKYASYQHIPDSCHMVYINSNICVTTGMSQDLHIIDHRYGTVRSIKFDDRAYNLWLANSQIFVNGVFQTFVFDV